VPRPDSDHASEWNLGHRRVTSPYLNEIAIIVQHLLRFPSRTTHHCEKGNPTMTRGLLGYLHSGFSTRWTCYGNALERACCDAKMLSSDHCVLCSYLW